MIAIFEYNILFGAELNSMTLLSSSYQFSSSSYQFLPSRTFSIQLNKLIITLNFVPRTYIKWRVKVPNLGGGLNEFIKTPSFKERTINKNSLKNVLWIQ